MKVNAPEKIYLEAIYPDNGVLPNGLNYTPSPTDIEYTRTDTFINKVCEWLKNFNDFHNIMRYSDCCEVPLKQIIEDFRNYMEE